MTIDKTQKQQIAIHKNSYLMYENTKKETRERMKEAMNTDGSKKWTEEDIENRLQQLQELQDDIKQKYLFAGGKEEDLLVEPEKPTKTLKNKIKVQPTTKTKTQSTNKKKIPVMKYVDNSDIIGQKKETNEIVEEVIKETPKKEPVKQIIKTNTTEQSIIPEGWDSMTFNESFDVIPLPSKGMCYEGNMSKIAVSYLTANDENMIVSPNLYRDGLILDYLLKAKIKNKNIDPDDLLEGDREAIILWLRATGYGTQYPITVTDNKTGINFDTVVDLTQIKHKPFLLEGDENGHFDYTLPISKDEIKFRFLTHADNKRIDEIEKQEQVNVKKDRLTQIVNELNEFIENSDELNKDEKLKLYESKRNINKWIEKLDIDNDLGYTHKLTNKLELSIVSINGNTDREYISEYIENMNVRDAVSIRRYIAENEPGLDYSVTVEKPESLGGGSMPVFLSLDEYVFLNIT